LAVCYFSGLENLTTRSGISVLRSHVSAELVHAACQRTSNQKQSGKNLLAKLSM